MPEKVVLAYSGGLDTSIIIPWLKENYSYEVIAMVGDVGQGDDIEAVVEKAYATGASKVIVEDLRDEFLTGYVFPAQIFAGDIVGASGDREASSGSGAARGSNRGRTRMHRQGKRSGAV
jgi:argininosuccinate synthase